MGQRFSLVSSIINGAAPPVGAITAKSPTKGGAMQVLANGAKILNPNNEAAP